MHDEAYRLHEDDDVVIRVKYVERDPVLRDGGGARRSFGHDVEHTACPNLVGRFARPAIDRDATVLDPALELGATRNATLVVVRGLRQSRYEKPVEPLPRGIRRYDEVVRYQIFDLMCPLALIRMSTRARS
jgi:hypothetical protein